MTKPYVSDRVEIIIAPWGAHKDTLSSIRHEVFINEQGVPEEEEWDDRDESATHLLAYLAHQKLTALGTLRLLPNHKLTRMAVLKHYRHQGIGTLLIEKAVHIARQNQWPIITLDAQIQAISFYEKLGFMAQGSPFMDAGILHKNMQLKLD